MEEEQADLLCWADTAISRCSRRFLGSTVDKVLRRAWFRC